MKRLLLLIFAALAISAPLARATGIGWGNTAFDSLKMYDSQGSLLDNTFTFELGTWATGFTPTATNVASWSSNWKVISSAFAPDVNGWVSLDANDPGVNDPDQNIQYFSRSMTFNSNGTVQGGGPSIFTTNEQAYIWVFNTKTVTPGSEWALVTDSSLGATSDDIWRVPDPSGVLNQPVLWNLETADTAVFGSVNGVMGAGDQGVDPGANRLQTFNPVSVVPEPGSALLVLLAGMAVRMRRRSRQY
ncbi:MAG: hypothetical protein JWO89_3833 [Verrucomicrobiaceae bacterium]|nr:hypothetical protein [Verrucomicrobiaceae bacterium]